MIKSGQDQQFMFKSKRHYDDLVEAIECLSESTKALLTWLRSHMGSATKLDLEEMEERMAEQIVNFGAAVEAAFVRIGKSVDELTKDVAELNRKIAELQNSPGAITPQDQAILDSIQSQATGIADKLDALDQQTPSVEPAQQ